MKYHIILFLIIGICFSQSTGIIQGRAVDLNTQEPLVGVNVQIEELEIGTVTNSDGYYNLDNIPSGTRHILFSIIGYEKQVILNLPVTSVRPITVNVEMVISPIELQSVKVHGNVFSSSAESILSSININNFEFRSNPGSSWDVQRTVQSAPSVINIGDHINEIIIRGGSPGENLFIMDNIEIHNPNHFGIEGNGGGGFSIINSLFVENVEFTPGAFPARFGDKASSSMNIDIIEGSKTNYEFDIDISMAGVGVKAEGPINKGRGSFIIGSLYSYFKNIVTNIGFTAVPYFNNHQVKIAYDLNKNNKLIFNGLYANNNINTITDRVNESYFGVSSFDHESTIIIGGMTLKSLLGKKLGYGLTTFSSTYQKIKQNVYDYGFTEYPWFIRDNYLGETTLKTDWFLITDLGEINTGASYKRINYDHNEWLNANITFEYDTTYWNNNSWIFPEGISKPEEIKPVFYQPTMTHDLITDFEKYAYYFQYTFKIKNMWELRSGIRFDYFTGTSQFNISSRINLKYSINPSNSAHIAYGRHYQYPNYFMVLKSAYNTNLKTKYSDQIILGYEHFFQNDFRGTLEFYYKNYQDLYSHYYWAHEPEQFPEELSHLLDWENEGSMVNYGIELLLHKKLSKNWFGIISYSWNNANAKDMRTMKSVPEIDIYMNDGRWYPWNYEIRHKILFNGGWKNKLTSKECYKKLKNKTYYKIFSPLLPIGDEIELSFQYSYISGRPYTDKVYIPQLFDWKYPKDGDWNGRNYPNYQRFDLMFLKRNNFKNMNIVLYVNFINIFNRDNVLDWLYNSNGTREIVWHFKTLPIGGITFEL